MGVFTSILPPRNQHVLKESHINHHCKKIKQNKNLIKVQNTKRNISYSHPLKLFLTSCAIFTTITKKSKQSSLAFFQSTSNFPYRKLFLFSAYIVIMQWYLIILPNHSVSQYCIFLLLLPNNLFFMKNTMFFLQDNRSLLKILTQFLMKTHKRII